MQFQNLIALLDASAPDVMQQWRLKHPGAKDVLSSARQLGEESGAASNADRLALLDLVQASLAHVTESLGQVATKIRKRMKSVSRMKFLGSLVASVSGATAASLTYIELGDKMIALFGALVGMAGGALGLLADYFERSPSGLRIAGTDEYAKLIGMIGEVELIKLKLGRDAVMPVPDDQLKAMLEKLDEYSLQVIRLGQD
jgi:hypothetical protein